MIVVQLAVLVIATTLLGCANAQSLPDNAAYRPGKINLADGQTFSVHVAFGLAKSLSGYTITYVSL